ncbi:putative integrase ORF3 [Nosema granulosis]|uniref:Integrase ORF3 n=1 Tax=Nosema granulosis TaxID=83296 RepID=A0A9P6GXQ9_9MICR|nr:putative integrase ORF3 [Nosema granulosis]
MEIDNVKRYVILGIDYFTRKLWGKVIDSKETKGIKLALEKWIYKDGFLEEIITDNGKEFCNESFGKWCADNKIIHIKVGLEAHKSNGRIERGYYKTGKWKHRREAC